MDVNEGRCSCKVVFAEAPRRPSRGQQELYRREGYTLLLATLSAGSGQTLTEVLLRVEWRFFVRLRYSFIRTRSSVVNFF